MSEQTSILDKAFKLGCQSVHKGIVFASNDEDLISLIAKNPDSQEELIAKWQDGHKQERFIL